MGSLCSCFSYPLVLSAWVSVLQGVLLGFSQWCLVLEYMLIVLMTGSEVRNSLCHSLGKITTPESLNNF